MKPITARARLVAAVSATVYAALLAAPPMAGAHGLGGRTDLPIPEWLFGWAGAAVLILSFVALGALWQRPLLEQARWRPLNAGLGRVLGSSLLEAACGAIGVGLLGLLIYAGFEGGERVDTNIVPTFVYIVFWLGLVPLSVLFGDVFRAFNPWRAVGRAVSELTWRWAPGTLAYPEWLGRWPAAVGLAGFAWLELVSSQGDRPETLALAICVYSLLTWLGMYLYGVETYSQRGEAFSVYFGLLARLSVFERRDGRLGLRTPLSGLATVPALPGTVALVVVMIGTVGFDGFSGGGTWQGILDDLLDPLRDMGLNPSNASQVANSIGLLAMIALTFAFYRLGVAGMRWFAGGDSARNLARAFAPSLVPIALAYVAAHYVSLLLLQGQDAARLASDPLGKGSDLLGTASWTVDYSWIGANTFWYLQVTFVVLGHAAALALAHDRALVLHGNVSKAVRSQYCMLGVMIGFTSLALWLLSEANKG